MGMPLTFRQPASYPFREHRTLAEIFELEALQERVREGTWSREDIRRLRELATRRERILRACGIA